MHAALVSLQRQSILHSYFVVISLQEHLFDTFTDTHTVLSIVNDKIKRKTNFIFIFFN